jgi:predicted adenylyl cyclase CyaB
MKIRDRLKEMDAEFKGVDNQRDVYFDVKNGRLKLRKGDIENHLIYYQRDDESGPKQADVILFATQQGSSLEDILTKSLGIKVVVEKRREIYFIDNVKFHLDWVSGLGSFMEVEVIDKEGQIGVDKLRQQCNRYLEMFDIKPCDLVSKSYSDLLLEKQPFRH